MRIAVMGTRGKTSASILLHSELRRKGFKVVCKATGALPFFCHEGRCERIRRKGRTRLYENLTVLKIPADYHVLENHGTSPYTMRAFNHFVKPEVVLLINARLDHTEHMGESKHSIAKSMVRALNKEVRLVVVGDDIFLDYLKEMSVIEAYPKGPPGSEVPEMVNSLLMELGLGGIDVERFRSMIENQLKYREGPVPWYDASKVNDPESLSMILDWLGGRPDLAIQLRRDRPGRTKAFLRFVRERRDTFGKVAVSGHWSERFARIVGGRSFPDSEDGAKSAVEWLDGPLVTAANRTGRFMLSLLRILGLDEGIPTLFGSLTPDRICSGL